MTRKKRRMIFFFKEILLHSSHEQSGLTQEQFRSLHGGTVHRFLSYIKLLSLINQFHEENGKEVKKIWKGIRSFTHNYLGYNVVIMRYIYKDSPE